MNGRWQKECAYHHIQSMPVHPAFLKNLNLLRDLPAETLAAVAQKASERSFARREMVLKKGDVGLALCFLLEGRLQGVDFTVDGREVGLYFIDPNDYFDELTVIDGQPRPEVVIAVARSRVLYLPREEARKLMFISPATSEQVTTRLALRLRQASAQRTLLALPNPFQRLCAQLLLMSATSGNKVEIIHAPTHQEIAIMINASRETVTRAFQVLQVRGTLKRDGTLFSVEDPAYLKDVAEGKLEPPKAG